jgi:hypothetical protein
MTTIPASEFDYLEHTGARIWFDGGNVHIEEDNRTLAEAQAEKQVVIAIHAANLRQTIRASVNPWATPEEMATWPIKRAEAEAYQSSQNPADAPTLAIEAQVRNIALADIVTRVLTNAVALLEAEITIAGTSGLHRDAVAALETIAEVDAYDYSAGWPV